MCIRGRGGNAGLIDANDRQGHCAWESREMKMHASPNNAINADVQQRRSALHAGYGGRYALSLAMVAKGI